MDRCATAEELLIACVDVHYGDGNATAGCILFRGWAADAALSETVVVVNEVAAYQPGHFYLRELPCLLQVLEASGSQPGIVIVDGYVWLDDVNQPGLGAHLYEALGKSVAVVGVAKTHFLSATSAVAVSRGTSRSPLHVTAVGLGTAEAAARVREMHGPYRIPTMLKRVDSLCRGHGTQYQV